MSSNNSPRQAPSRPGNLSGQSASPLVLVVDDEPSICWAVQRALMDEGYAVETASSAEAGLKLASEKQPSLIMLDVRLPREDGLSALPKFREVAGGAPIVIMTAFGDLETAVAAVQRGAADYLTKPFKLEDVSRVCREQLQSTGQSTAPHGEVQRRSGEPPKIIGTSPAMQQVFRQIALVAPSDLTVLITGETGTGKELVAAAIHRHSNRRDQPYLAIAPVAFNPDLIESELFGHVRGAFTGADENREGLFEQAEGGTVLLDEIGELSMGLQAKLLRVLEQGEYCRVGETTPRRCNVRILAATHCDLAAAVAKGTFRQDLYYRLNGMHVHLPSLRERVEDIAPLCSYFMSRQGFSGTAQLGSPLLSDLAARPWHGNIRELRHAIEHAMVVARGRPLQPGDFPTSPDLSNAPVSISDLETTIHAWAAARVPGAATECQTLHADFLAASEPVLFQFAIAKTGGNRAKAAELLGIHRGTLRERIRTYQKGE